MIGMAAGMAQQGMRMVAYTIATFALFRPFEFVRDDVCYQNLPITIVGIGGGVTYSTLGATHHAQEDISIATSVPNLQVLCPSDPLETEMATKWCLRKSKKPTYLRLGKAGEENFTSISNEPWEFGKIRKIVNGRDIAIISYGPIIKIAFQLIKSNNLKIKNASIYSCSTLKPLDENGIKKIFKKYKKIVVIEETSGTGTLGNILKSKAFQFDYKGKINDFSLKDQFIHTYGSHDDILNSHDLTYQKILKKI
jgi:transketolase